MLLLFLLLFGPPAGSARGPGHSEGVRGEPALDREARAALATANRDLRRKISSLEGSGLARLRYGDLSRDQCTRLYYIQKRFLKASCPGGFRAEFGRGCLQEPGGCACELDINCMKEEAEEGSPGRQGASGESVSVAERVATLKEANRDLREKMSALEGDGMVRLKYHQLDVRQCARLYAGQKDFLKSACPGGFRAEFGHGCLPGPEGCVCELTINCTKEEQRRAEGGGGGGRVAPTLTPGEPVTPLGAPPVLEEAGRDLRETILLLEGSGPVRLRYHDLDTIQCARLYSTQKDFLKSACPGGFSAEFGHSCSPEPGGCVCELGITCRKRPPTGDPPGGVPALTTSTRRDLCRSAKSKEECRYCVGHHHPSPVKSQPTLVSLYGRTHSRCRHYW